MHLLQFPLFDLARTMGNTRKGENSKRAAGLARKAEQASQKAAQQAAREEAEEAEKWSRGAKSNKKK